jgi:putative oxidoreductase
MSVPSAAVEEHVAPSAIEVPWIRGIRERMVRHAPLLVRTLLAGIFLYAGVLKVLHPADFALAISRYRLLPGSAVSAVAIVLPWLEIVAALALLLLARMRRTAASLLLLLMVIFTIALCLNAWRGISVDCGCFSIKPGASRNTALAILRDFGLSILAMYCYVTSPPARIDAARPAQIRPSSRE